MQVPPLTLAFLAFHWGDAYLLSAVRERWVALRRDGRYFLVAGTLAELETLIEADYRVNPVSRDYDRRAGPAPPPSTSPSAKMVTSVGTTG